MRVIQIYTDYPIIDIFYIPIRFRNRKLAHIEEINLTILSLKGQIEEMSSRQLY